jgi:phosphoenolpyruvate carboxylase
VALSQLEIYTTAVLLATINPPPPPKFADWRRLMDRLGEVSCASYRGVVFQHPHFIPYFSNATPQEELGNLNIGSRPARRKKVGWDAGCALGWLFLLGRGPLGRALGCFSACVLDGLHSPALVMAL